MKTPVDMLVDEAKKKQLAAIEAIKKQFMTVRTGRANPGLVENIKVDYYGTKTPLKQIASIASPEARLIVIQPWDKGALDAIEKAILSSDVGITPNNDGKVIRLTLPQLTHERRDELKKMLHRIAEEGRVSIRNARHQAVEKAVEQEKNNNLTEDDKFLTKEKVQKMTDEHIKLIDEALKQKEDEIEK